MILNGIDGATDSRTTLDDLFRRAGVRNPQGVALLDPPYRAGFTDGAPRQLTYAQADRVISAFAARLRRLGLQTDTVVAIQLANTVESIITLLAVLRAGMIAVPLPLLWRRHDMLAALRLIGAKAIVTSSRVGSARHVDVAMQVAAELFPVRYVCGFGRDLPDGAVALDDLFDADQRDVAPACMRPGNPAAHVAVITFNLSADGLAPMARNHLQLMAGGMAGFLKAEIAQDATILSTIPLGSFAGVALTLLPWLLSGGTLRLHHAFDPETFAAQCRDADAVVLPGPVVAPFAQAGHLDGALKSMLALWRSPERIGASSPWQGDATFIDIAAYGEIDLLAARRGADGNGSPIASGSVTTRPASGITTVGGYSFRQTQVDALVAQVDPTATIAALPDAYLDQRLAGAARDREAIMAQLEAQGVNPLIAGAFCPRGRANAA